MTLAQFKDFLKTKIKADNGITVGSIDGNKEKCIGVYARAGAAKGRVCLGQAPRLLYKRVALLLHWTKSVAASEEKALELHRVLQGNMGEMAGGWRIVYIDPGEAPIPVDRDQRGISEWVINATIAYERID